MKRHGLCSLVILGVIILMATSASAFFMNFEEGLGNDGGNITGIPGVTFTNSDGLNWLYADILNGSYNAHSIDTGYGSGSYQMYGYVSAWLGTSGNWGRIDFTDKNGTWFQTGVTSSTAFTVEAYNAADVVIATATLAAGNLNQPDMAWLRVDAPIGQNISYVKVHDSDNFWTVDNMTGDMAGGPVPIPGGLVLLGTGMLRLWRHIKTNKS
jgi:hypothetical protein